MVTPRSEAIGRLVAAGEVHVPASCDLEVASALRHGLGRGRLTPARAAQALTDHLDLPLQRHGLDLLLHRVLALRENFTVYDAVYVALAEALEASLLTVDEPLRRAVEAHTTVALIATEPA